jgi:DNA-directed RNA polymerase subunit RPC12/RpoP
MTYKDDESHYICQKCGKIFQGKNVRLKKFAKNVEIPFAGGLMLKFIDKDDKIRGSGSTHSIKDTDRVMACPHCEEVGLFGFQEIKENVHEHLQQGDEFVL